MILEGLYLYDVVQHPITPKAESSSAAPSAAPMPSPLPVLSYATWPIGALAKRPRSQPTIQDPQRDDINNGLLIAIACMEMWRIVIVVKHRNDYPIEPTNFGIAA